MLRLISALLFAHSRFVDAASFYFAFSHPSAFRQREGYRVTNCAHFAYIYGQPLLANTLSLWICVRFFVSYSAKKYLQFLQVTYLKAGSLQKGLCHLAAINAHCVKLIIDPLIFGFPYHILFLQKHFIETRN